MTSFSNEDSLVQINSTKDGEEKQGISRRNFLKIIGAASAAGVAGCADSAKQKVFPHVKGQDDQVPGVAVWYQSSCNECSAGCGITVRTREGRAVKVEGNKDHPINQGGLCALGQASLQGLYDPDRVRQPLENTSGPGEKPVFRPISWEAAYKKITTQLKKSGPKGFITGEVSGSIEKLLSEWTSAFSLEHVVYDPLQPLSLAHASELVYGKYGIPEFSFDKAEVVLNFGADFLETWVSPCEYARGWSKSRKSSHPARVIHVEPRLSLTGANADMCLSAKPGTEVRLASAILKILLTSGKGSGSIKDEILEKLNDLVKDIELSSVSAETGIPKEKILLIANYLSNARSSLVVAGGAATATDQSLPLMVVTCFLNLVLSNIGKTVHLGSMRKPRSSLQKMARFVAETDKGKTGLVFIDSTNPNFTLPRDYGFEYAMKKVGLVVSFSRYLDETSELADLILPTDHPLEGWGDAEPKEGVYNLTQPSMKPVFDTKGLGDILLDLAREGGQKSVTRKSDDFYMYLRSEWRERFQPQSGERAFDRWWDQALQKGGNFDSSLKEKRVRVKVDEDVFSLDYQPAAFKHDKAGKEDLVLYPYPSVKSFDGRAANRPWLQELPDPITKIVWDAWAELHPETAQKKGIAQGDLVTVRNHYGEVNVPAYLTEHVHKDIIAVPIGQGHTSYGRYAKEVAQVGSVYSLLSAGTEGKKTEERQNVSLLSTQVQVRRGRGKPTLVVTQGSDSQKGHELARTKYIEDSHNGNGHHDSHGDDHGHHGGHHHHEPKQMYEQRKHPLYHWSLAVDLAACTGCSACVVACYAENNIPVVGKKVCDQGREMSWLRIERYYDNTDEELQVSFLPMMCQHCGNAPCEPVCPVYATYHNDEGLNVMVYNRCVGTRYCSNNCSYKVRRYNWFEFDWPEPMNMQLNPDVTKRSAGVMEKCTFCIQRITEAKDLAKDHGRVVQDGEVQPACVQSCPTEALTFGNLNDPKSKVSKLSHDERSYKVLDHHLNTQPSVHYLENVKYKV